MKKRIEDISVRRMRERKPELKEILISVASRFSMPLFHYSGTISPVVKTSKTHKPVVTLFQVMEFVFDTKHKIAWLNLTIINLIVEKLAPWIPSCCLHLRRGIMTQEGTVSRNPSDLVIVYLTPRERLESKRKGPEILLKTQDNQVDTKEIRNPLTSSFPPIRGVNFQRGLPIRLNLTWSPA